MELAPICACGLGLRGLGLSVLESCHQLWGVPLLIVGCHWPLWGAIGLSRTPSLPKRGSELSSGSWEGDVAGSAQGGQHCDGNVGGACGISVPVSYKGAAVSGGLKGFFWSSGT